MAVYKRAPLRLSLGGAHGQKEPFLNLEVNGRAACCLHAQDSLIADHSSCAEFLLVLTARQMPPMARFTWAQHGCARLLHMIHIHCSGGR